MSYFCHYFFKCSPKYWTKSTHYSFPQSLWCSLHWHQQGEGCEDSCGPRATGSWQFRAAGGTSDLWANGAHPQPASSEQWNKRSQAHCPKVKCLPSTQPLKIECWIFSADSVKSIPLSSCNRLSCLDCLQNRWKLHTTSQLSRLQTQPLRDATQPIWKIHPFSKMCVIFEPMIQLWCPLRFWMSSKIQNSLYYDEKHFLKPFGLDGAVNIFSQRVRERPNKLANEWQWFL